MTNQQIPAVIKLEQGRELFGKDLIGVNKWYRMAQRGEIPGLMDIGEGGKPAYRIRTKPFLAWLEGEADQSKTPYEGA
jgi:hypothetical protein